MPSSFSPKINAWQQAEMIAQAAESALNSAVSLHCAGNGPAPTAAEQEAVRALRDASDAALKRALDEPTLRSASTQPLPRDVVLHNLYLREQAAALRLRLRLAARLLEAARTSKTTCWMRSNMVAEVPDDQSDAPLQV